MCIAAPGRVVKIKGRAAEVKFGSLTRRADASLKPGVKKGDYVLVHAGFIMEILEKEDALERIKFFKETGLE